MDIGFEKVECEHLAVFRSKDGGWQLSKKLGFHKGSPARDYLVLWVEENGKWTYPSISPIFDRLHLRMI
jgi:hypothetical protein